MFPCGTTWMITTIASHDPRCSPPPCASPVISRPDLEESRALVQARTTVQRLVPRANIVPHAAEACRTGGLPVSSGSTR